MAGDDDTLLQVTRRDGVAAQGRANPLLLPGTRVEHYEVRDVVGRGAMGVVYRARDQKLGRQVALKLCATEAEGDTCSMLCSLLVREGQTMARLSHPNLVAVFDIGQFNHCVYVAMEYVDGQSLRQWAAGAPRGHQQRLAAMLQAGRGLAHAHAAGVVHRDFKPDNVLIGHDGTSKVTDFGLARVLGQSLDGAGPAAACGCGPDARTLAADAVVGTPRYMAPEQLDGAPGDEASDQFSFATSTWELLYGEQPFRASTAAELRRAVAAGAIVEPGHDETPAASTALRRALRFDPGARYPRLAELLDALAA